MDDEQAAVGVQRQGQAVVEGVVAGQSVGLGPAGGLGGAGDLRAVLVRLGESLLLLMDHGGGVDLLGCHGIGLADLIGDVGRDGIRPDHIQVILLVGDDLVVGDFNAAVGEQGAEVHLHDPGLIGFAGDGVGGKGAVGLHRPGPVVIAGIGLGGNLGVEHLGDIQIFEGIAVLTPEQISVAVIADELGRTDLHRLLGFIGHKIVQIAVVLLLFHGDLARHLDGNEGAVAGKAVELDVQLPVLGSLQIEVLIHREGIGRKAAVSLAYRQVGDGRIGVVAVLIHDGGGQEALSAKARQRSRLTLQALCGLVGEVVIPCPAGFMGFALGIRGVGLVVVEHIGNDAVGLVRVWAGSDHILELVARIVVILSILGGLVVHDDVVAGGLVIDRLGIVVVVLVVGELGDLAEALGGLGKLHREDVQDAHDPSRILLQSLLDLGLSGILAGLGLQLRCHLGLEGAVFGVCGGGPGEDDLVSRVGEAGPGVGSRVDLHGLGHRPGVVARVVERPFQGGGLHPVAGSGVVQEDHQIFVVSDGDDLAGGLGIGVLHQRSGVDSAVARHELAVVGDPLGINMVARVVAEANARVVLGGGVDDGADDARLLVHLDDVLGGPVDDAVVIGVVLQGIGKLLYGRYTVKLRLCLRTCRGEQLVGVHHFLQLIDTLLRVGSGSLAVAFALLKAAFDIADALVGPPDLLEVVQEAVCQRQGPGGAVKLNGGEDQIEGAGEGDVRGVAPAGVKEVRVPVGDVVAVAGLEAQGHADPGAKEFIEAHADGAGKVDPALELEVELEVLAVELRIVLEALEGLLRIALGAQEERDVQAALHIPVGRNRADHKCFCAAHGAVEADEAAGSHEHHVVALLLAIVGGDLHIAVVQVETYEGAELEVGAAILA